MDSMTLTLVKALHTSEHDLAQVGVLFREAKFILATTMFSSWSIVFVNRFCNSVAYEFARFGRGRDTDYPLMWMHPLPSVVHDLLVRVSVISRLYKGIRERAFPSKKEEQQPA